MTPRQAEARRLALSGLTVKQIAAEMGLTRQTVAYHLKTTGTKAAPARVAPSDAEIVALYQEGLTDADIAREVGICADTVGRARRRAGVKARPGTAPILVALDVERLLSLAREGWRQADLAAEFGVSQVTISNTLIKHGHRRMTRRGSP